MKWVISCLIFFTASFAKSERPSQIVILRGDGDYPPNETQIDNKLTGYHIELIENVAQRLKLNIEIRSMPWNRALKTIMDGKADAITYIGRSASREQYIYFNKKNVLSVTTNKLLVLREFAKKIKFDGDLRQLLSFRIGVLGDYTYGKAFDEQLALKKVYVDDMKQFFPMLSNRHKRIDLAVVNEDECRNELKKMSNRDDFVLLEKVISSVDNYIGFSKKRNLTHLADEFGNALEDFRRTPQYDDLLKKYGKIVGG